MKTKTKEKKYIPTPQWLKEVLNRGFRPKRIYKKFDKSLYAYINPFSKKIINVPNIKIFAFEGLPGTGKTSIVNFFSEKGTSTVQQILPSEPLCDFDMPQSFYFRSDQMKTKYYLKSKDKICLLDRYYVSTLAYYWSYDKIHMTNRYRKALRWYKNSLKNKTLIRPFSVFCIAISPVLSLARKGREQSNSTNNLWCNKDFLKYFNNYYDYFYNNIEPKTRVIKLSGNMPMINLIKIVESIINEER